MKAEKINKTEFLRLQNENALLKMELKKHKRLSVGEYAAAKGVSRQSVSNWIAQGKLRTEKLGTIRLVIE